MKIFVRELTTREDLRRAMKTCLASDVVNEEMKPLSKKATRKALIQRHGSLNKYIFHIQALAPERVHSHLRTHHLMNEFYQCSTSRPDLVDNDGSYRVLDMYIPAKRLLEIFEVRACDCSWTETNEFFENLEWIILTQYPWFKNLLKPSCVYNGYCKEFKSDTCHYWNTQFVKDRKKLMEIVKEFKND